MSFISSIAVCTKNMVCSSAISNVDEDDNMMPICSSVGIWMARVLHLNEISDCTRLGLTTGKFVCTQ